MESTEGSRAARGAVVGWDRGIGVIVAEVAVDVGVGSVCSSSSLGGGDGVGAALEECRKDWVRGVEDEAW